MSSELLEQPVESVPEQLRPSTNDLQLFLLALCTKPEDYTSIGKLRQLLREQLTWDAAFVLCATEDGSTPLHYAVKSNNSTIAEILLNETNVRVTRRDNNDFLAVHYAIQNYNVGLIDLLVARSPQRLMTHETFTPKRETLLHFATRVDASKHSPVVQRFVTLGADPLQENADRETAYSIARDKGLCSAFYMNNYLLNRQVAEDRTTLGPDDVDDDEVRVRKREGRGEPCDGYSAEERRLVRHNEVWWRDGLECVRQLCAFVML